MINPYSKATLITPNDSTVVQSHAALLFGTTGNAVLIMEAGNTVTLPVVAGVIYPIRARVIKTSSHTAGTVHALEY